MHRDPSSDKMSPSERRRLTEVARIRSLMTLAQLTLSAIDKAHGLPAGTAGNILHEPHFAGERALAAALKTRPHLLWRSRYHNDGTRKSPQPGGNYRWQRRRASDAQEAA